MEILILNHYFEDSNERKFVKFRSSKVEDEVEEEGLLDLVNKKVKKRYRDTWIESDEEGTDKEFTTDPLLLNCTFMWEGSTFAFTSPSKLVLQRSKTGAGVLARFVRSLYMEEELEEKSKILTSQISWRIIPGMPFTVDYKKETLVDYGTYRSLKSGLSPENLWLKSEWIEFTVSGIIFYVRGQQIYYDKTDEDIPEFLEYGAKEKIIDYIKTHDSEFVPAPQNLTEEEENN